MQRLIIKGKKKLKGKKAIGEIFDDTHISTACGGAFCGVFFEKNEEEIFINAINESGLKILIEFLLHVNLVTVKDSFFFI